MSQESSFQPLPDIAHVDFSAPEGRTKRIEIELPTKLLQHFRDSGEDLDASLAEAVRLGAEPASRPPEPQGPANDPDPARRRRQLADALLHYSGRYWYLALLIPRLTREIAELRDELARLERSNAD